MTGSVRMWAKPWVARRWASKLPMTRWEAFAQAQAVIDFTAPEATLEFAALAAQARCVHVIGTTGMTDEQIAALEPASRHAAIIRAGNMSLGVNLLVQLTKKVAAALDEGF